MATKNPFEAREVRSRRGGRVKEPLSREAVVTEALRLLTNDGLEGVSLRKVALALDTGAASLYAYVDDLRSLYALMLDRALADVDVSGGKHRDWQEKIKAVLWSYGTVLFSNRGLAQLALGTIAFGPNALRMVDALLGFLTEGGVDASVAAWSVDLLLLYVTAIAAERSESGDPSDPSGPLALALARASKETHPHLHAARDSLLTGDGEARFSFAVDVLLDGIAAAPAVRRVTKKATRTKTKR